MQLQTILNRVESYKSFVYRDVKWDQEAVGLSLLVSMEHRKNSRPICSGCGQARPGYDRVPARRWEFVPLWQISVFFVYCLRRVDCPECGVMVESVPWGSGKRRQTKTYIWFLAAWAKRLSWKTAAEQFGTSWDTVYRCVRDVVLWGRLHQDVSGLNRTGS
jgi:transposase